MYTLSPTVQRKMSALTGTRDKQRRCIVAHQFSSDDSAKVQVYNQEAFGVGAEGYDARLASYGVYPSVEATDITIQNRLQDVDL